MLIGGVPGANTHKNWLAGFASSVVPAVTVKMLTPPFSMMPTESSGAKNVNTGKPSRVRESPSVTCSVNL